MRYFIPLFMFFPFNLYAKSLEAMANSAKSALMTLGSIVVGIGIIVAGFAYIKGNQEGKQKLSDVIIGGVCILGAAGIMAFIRRITG